MRTSVSCTLTMRDTYDRRCLLLRSCPGPLSPSRWPDAPPLLSPWHARSVVVAAATLLHAAVVLAAGVIFLSYKRECVRATGYGLAQPSICEWIGIWRIDGLLTQKPHRNGCILMFFISLSKRLTLNLPGLASESTTFPGSACRCWQTSWDFFCDYKIAENDRWQYQKPADLLFGEKACAVCPSARHLRRRRRRCAP